MLELSPLETAAKAYALSMPAALRVLRSKPTPVTVRPSNDVPSRRNADSSWSMTATSWPARSIARAREAPTRPQPMMTKCTTPTLHRRLGTGEGVLDAPRARLGCRIECLSCHHRDV